MESLALHPIPNRLLHSLLLSLPLPSPSSPRLLKSLLLRRLAAGASAAASCRTLDTLEMIEQLDRDRGLAPSPPRSLQLAYCCAAVDLTARVLRGGGELGDFFDAVNRVWNCRVGDLEVSEAKGLVSERLRVMRGMMEEAVGSRALRRQLRRRETAKEAKEAIVAYVKEAAKEMGAGTAEVRNGGNGVFTEGCCLSSGANQQQQSMSVIQENTLEPGNENNHNMAEVPHSDIVTEAAGLPSIETGHQLSDGGGCSMKAAGLPSIETGHQLSDGGGCSMSGFGEDHPREEPNRTEPCPCSNVLPAAAEVQTIETANGSNLQRVETCENVVDRGQSPSLDNGGEVAPTRDVNSGGSEHNINHDTVMEPAIADQHPRESEHNKENQNVSAKLRASLSDKGKRAINAEDTNNVAVNTERKGKTWKKRVSHAVGAPSIMDRNPTARTYEWDDSMDTTPGKSPNPVARRQSPRVKRKSSPGTNVPWTRNFSGRRKKKWWTEEEEHTLRKGVKKYGVGKWALIKESYPDILEERSSGDLKDKWRNITRKK